MAEHSALSEDGILLRRLGGLQVVQHLLAQFENLTAHCEWGAVMEICTQG